MIYEELSSSLNVIENNFTIEAVTWPIPIDDPRIEQLMKYHCIILG